MQQRLKLQQQQALMQQALLQQQQMYHPGMLAAAMSQVSLSLHSSFPFFTFFFLFFSFFFLRFQLRRIFSAEFVHPTSIAFAALFLFPWKKENRACGWAENI